jgi:hypothetical protein
MVVAARVLVMVEVALADVFVGLIWAPVADFVILESCMWGIVLVSFMQWEFIIDGGMEGLWWRAGRLK